MQVRKQQLELDMEQTGSKLGKEYVKAVYSHPTFFGGVKVTFFCLFVLQSKIYLENMISKRSL